MASIASDSGHVCSGDDCVTCAVNIASDATGRRPGDQPKSTAKPDREAKPSADATRKRRLPRGGKR